MNRETKRMLARQGQSPDGEAPADRRKGATAPARRPAPEARQRTSPLEFLREVRTELRRVAWPNRREVVNYSTIVLVTLLVLVALIFALDFVFARSILFLFEA